MSAMCFMFMARRRGEGGGPGVAAFIAGLILLVAYLLRPDLFHQFVAWVLESIFDALAQATGNEVHSPLDAPGDPNTMTNPNTTTTTTKER